MWYEKLSLFWRGTIAVAALAFAIFMLLFTAGKMGEE